MLLAVPGTAIKQQEEYPRYLPRLVSLRNPISFRVVIE